MPNALCRRAPGDAAQGFTLLEVLLALAISAIVLAGIGGVFYSALRLRERTTALLDESAPLYQAVSLLRRDFLGALPPGQVLPGDFRSGASGSLSAAQSYFVQFSTTTGVIRESAPWGDVQEVTYELREPEVRGRGNGLDLVRSLSRNLLTTTSLQAEEQVLLENVAGLEVSCFDGLVWRDSWDTSLTDTNLPSAVRVRIQMAVEDRADQWRREPIELVIPMVTQSRTNQTTTAATGGAG